MNYVEATEVPWRKSGAIGRGPRLWGHAQGRNIGGAIDTTVEIPS
jgi:hypothetical protein